MTTDSFSVSRRRATQMFCATAAGIVGLGSIPRAALARQESVTGAAAADWAVLRSQVAGELVETGQPAFEALRQSLVWNQLKPQRAPAAILRVAGVEDVQQAVRFARASNLKIAIRGGGHSWCASSMRDGGLLLDMSRLNALQVDQESATAIAQPAVRGEQLVETLTPLGLAFPVGHCPSVPLSGYLLNGGVGWNSGAWGPACMSLQAVDVVNAQGELLRADANQNSDYYWAARGAGPGFFAAAVGYHLRLHPLPEAIRTRVLFLPLAQLEAVGQWLNELVPKLRPEIEMTCIIGVAPPALPEEIAPVGSRVFMLMANAFADEAAQADEWLSILDSCPAEIRRFAPPVQDTPLPALHGLMAQAMPEGKRYSVDFTSCDASPAEVISSVAETAKSAPAIETFVMLVFLPPRPAEAPPMPDMAFSMINRSLVGAYGIWSDAGQDEAVHQWVRQVMAGLEPVRAGYYVGETDLLAEPDRARRCYSPEAWTRLEQLRAKYDPSGVFHTYLSPA